MVFIIVMAEKSISEFPRKYYTHTSTCTTKSDGVTLILKWTIKNFSGSEKEKVYLFPPIRASTKCDLEVSLVRSTRNFTSLFVENKIDNAINLKATTTIYDNNGKQLYREVQDFELVEKTDILLNFEDETDLPETLPNDSLLFHIKLDIFNLSREDFDVAEWGNESVIKLSEDFKNWILEELPEKIFLKTKDGQIPANRAILCARSPIFKKMFYHPTSEQEKNIVHIDDVNETTLKSLIDFIYSGKTDFPKTELQSLKELYYAADKYDVQDLRKICAQTMIPILTTQNSLEVLLMALQHSDQYLKKECLTFIRTCIQELMDTESWVHLKESDPPLAVEVLETCLKI